MSLLDVEHLRIDYRRYGVLRALFKREASRFSAVADVSFSLDAGRPWIRSGSVIRLATLSRGDSEPIGSCHIMAISRRKRFHSRRPARTISRPS